MSIYASLDYINVRDFDKSHDFDLIVIGSGPAGQKAAITGAKEGAKVAIIELDPLAGGACLNTGTVPSKSLREAVMYLTGYRERGYYGENYRLKEKIGAGDLVDRTNHVIRLERETINEDLAENGVTRIVGFARLVGPHDVEVMLGDDSSTYRGANIIVSVGAKPRRPPEVPFDGVNIIDSDGVFRMDNELRPLPDSLIVLGAGVIGIEYTSMFAALGIPITLVDTRDNPLGFVDKEIAAILYDHLERLGVKKVFGRPFKEIRLNGTPGDHESRALLEMEDGEVFDADELLFTLGRTPSSRRLGLAEIGVELDKRNYVVVDDRLRTNIPSIWAAGDVIGFPSLASTSAEQGRIAALGALGLPVHARQEILPYGIYTIPEISMVGKTEQDMITDGTEYFVGTALWRDTARGKIIGDLNGAIKLVFRKSDLKLAGVHIIGEGATELLHIGQAVMHFQGGPEYFIENVFNYPTLAEAYKLAAFNALNRLKNRAIHSDPLSQQVEQQVQNQQWVSWNK